MFLKVSVCYIIPCFPRFCHCSCVMEDFFVMALRRPINSSEYLLFCIAAFVVSRDINPSTVPNQSMNRDILYGESRFLFLRLRGQEKNPWSVNPSSAASEFCRPLLED